MDSGALRRVGAQFEGLLIEQILAPMVQPLGEGAAIALAPLAQSLAAHDTGGFGAILAATLSAHDDER